MKNLLFFFLILSGLSLISCGGSKDEKTPDNPSSISSEDNDDEPSNTANNSQPANLQDAMKQAEKAIKDAGMQQKEPIGFRELQKMTPEKLAGMERTSKSGETAGALGMKISTAEAKYKDSDGKVYEIKVIDTGGIGMGMMGMAAWSMATIDKEDDDGYERTSKLDGYKSFEKFRKRNNSCELSVIALERFVVTGECRECDMDKLKKLIKEMGLDDMKDLKAGDGG